MAYAHHSCLGKSCQGGTLFNGKFSDKMEGLICNTILLSRSNHSVILALNGSP